MFPHLTKLTITQHLTKLTITHVSNAAAGWALFPHSSGHHATFRLLDWCLAFATTRERLASRHHATTHTHLGLIHHGLGIATLHHGLAHRGLSRSALSIAIDHAAGSKILHLGAILEAVHRSIPSHENWRSFQQPFWAAWQTACQQQSPYAWRALSPHIP